jgi:hypothetical protein
VEASRTGSLHFRRTILWSATADNKHLFPPCGAVCSLMGTGGSPCGQAVGALFYLYFSGCASTGVLSLLCLFVWESDRFLIPPVFSVVGITCFALVGTNSAPVFVSEEF